MVKPHFKICLLKQSSAFCHSPHRTACPIYQQTDRHSAARYESALPLLHFFKFKFFFSVYSIISLTVPIPIHTLRSSLRLLHTGFFCGLDGDIRNPIRVTVSGMIFRSAFLENIVAKLCNPIRDDELFQLIAACERICSDIFHTVGQNDLLRIGASAERVIVFLFCSFFENE